jgi:hypothetical protein
MYLPTEPEAVDNLITTEEIENLDKLKSMQIETEKIC